MIKKILKLYLISLLILGILALIYTLFLNFSKNDANLSYVTIILGGLFFLIFNFMLIKIFKSKVFIYVTLFFIINYSVIILILISSGNEFTDINFLKITIYYVISLIGGILSVKKK